jgi:hypothetical protein
MSTYEQGKLEAKYTDLMNRSKMMRASGYIASADELLMRASQCAAGRYALAEKCLIENGRMHVARQQPQRSGGLHA